MINRRTVTATALLGGGGLAIELATPAMARGWRSHSSRVSKLPVLFDDLEQRTFRWFWDTGNPANGLVPDAWPNPEFCSIAAVGFALTAYPIGVERGWITRAAARERTLATLRFFERAPQGEGASGVAGYKGFFYHFLHMDSGLRFGDVELSTVDSTMLFLGMLFAAEYYVQDHPDEREIKRLANALYERANWDWFRRGQAVLSMGWHPGVGFIPRNWDGYNEGMMVNLLALGSSTHAVGPDAWSAWCAPYDKCWRGSGATRRLAFAPMFGHQYSHMWIDFRGIRDAAMRDAGMDYFENSRRATWAQRNYGIRNPMGWTGYSQDIWGLTASAGPADVQYDVDGRIIIFRSYSARGPVDEPDGFDDGTIAPTAAIGSLAFAPEIAVPATLALHAQHGDRIYGRYGFYDAFNPTFRKPAKPFQRGSVDPVRGWVSQNYLGIDQGPILGAIANTRDGLIWRLMRRSVPIRRGLERAGFTGGWLAA
ncbi:glucoamylase family protein [Sphingomonas sp. TREG-RG-20F-R18-01]|uniref:glucoamylase family protein n=1 Tax=Sphingomonas sp. TREG-RG-20F-R18-01 TaxID=2914982 RepID=UPI001F589999